MNVEGDPAKQRSWTAADGVVWTRRGTGVTAKRVRALLADPGTQVLRTSCCFTDSREVAPAARDEYWAYAEPFLTGKRPADTHDDVDALEFKDAAGRRLLIFFEVC